MECSDLASPPPQLQLRLDPWRAARKKWICILDSTQASRTEPSHTKHSPHIARKPQAVEEREEIEQSLIGRVRDEAFDGYAIGCSCISSALR